ncbi:MATE family efflux transporter [Allosphingosinicella deserti]|uniref:Polysaccharide biosynthesis protein n=1 Tax=Allosphingosinicella deserti TaxID=2116704 RepID=A0A2P7QJZ9_9SPHN|nr:hypothetical protein [Sphingomonas deserti]PSJ38284.1 hypothetical protein C7I55_17650 [Sphingomonas deserti]
MGGEAPAVAVAARRSGVGSGLLRYAMAAVGPVAGAGAQFVLSLVLLHLLTPAAFGKFAFLLVTSIFSAGLWSALFCAPLPVILNRGDAAGRAPAVRALTTLSTLGSVVVFCLFSVLGLALEVSLSGALLFGVYAAMFVLRWFARTHAYAHDRPIRVTISDLVYSVVLLGGVGALAIARATSVELCYAVMALSAALGMLPFGRAYLRTLLSIDRSAFAHYRPVWREHSSWSLVGVITTEATINAHVYIVTLIAGPVAYAPIAATALMIRPMAVAQNALGDFERPRMARQIGSGRIDDAGRAVLFFRMVLLAAWIATCAGAIMLFVVDPHLVFPRDYDRSVLAIGTALWLAVSGVRLVRTPESTLLQAAGAFRPLAHASMVSCGISIVAVLVMLVAVGPLWSILGILAGELVFGGWTWRQAHRWRRQAAAKARSEDSDGQEPSIQAEDAA